MMALFASRSEGAILEIGTYVGGSTTALASGAAPDVPFVAIEVGLPYPTHPTIPSTDVIGDLRRNLARFGFPDRVKIVQRFASSPLAFRDAREALAGTPVGLLALDADGDVGRHLGRFTSLMRPDCLLVLDDYDAPGARDKEALTRGWVDQRVREGVLREFGVFRWGTWFGQIAGAAALQRIQDEWSPFRQETGHAWICEVVLPALPDAAGHGSRSPVRLVEVDGGVARELGPAHAPHAEIRAAGGGRFSHWSSVEIDPSPASGEWEATLYFSSSDNSDPCANGRHYSAIVGDETIPLRDPLR